MRILFLSTGRLDNIDNSGIYTDLLREFKDNGHEVYVMCARERRYKLPTEYVTEGGVNFLRIKIGNLTKTNLVEKGITTICLESIFLKRLKKYFSDTKFDLILYSTPPITFERVIKYIKKRDGATSYLLLKDIFPQNAIDLNLFSKKSPLYWYFRRKEVNLYRNSDFIGCMSKANVDYILKHNPNLSRDIVEVCPNSIRPIYNDLDNGMKKQIRNKYGIPLNKTVFIYGGNLGKPQGIDFLIQCLQKNEDSSSSYFVIVGSGTEFGKLQSFFKREKLKNSTLLPQLPKQDYDLLVSSCDVGLIFLDKRFSIPNFPSRLLSYMQASLPVLAATDINTDIGLIAEQGNFGFWCKSGDIKSFSQLVRRLCNQDLRKQLGYNSRRYLEENYTTKHSYDIIMSHFSC